MSAIGPLCGTPYRYWKAGPREWRCQRDSGAAGLVVQKQQLKPVPAVQNAPRESKSCGAFGAYRWVRGVFAPLAQDAQQESPAQPQAVDVDAVAEPMADMGGEREREAP